MTPPGEAALPASGSAAIEQHIDADALHAASQAGNCVRFVITS
jgi:hypothetical protein